MAHELKFKVGDKIVANDTCAYTFREDRTGTIREVIETDYVTYPYVVDFNCAEVFGATHGYRCSESELSLAQ